MGCITEAAVEAMRSMADKLQVQGVSVLGLLPEEGGKPSLVLGPIQLMADVVGKAVREPNRGPEDTGTNYGAVAFGKWWDMAYTGLPSGESQQAPMKGTLGFKGGVLFLDATLRVFYLVAFSGGSPEQDLEIAQAGLEVLKEWVPQFAREQEALDIALNALTQGAHFDLRL